MISVLFADLKSEAERRGGSNPPAGRPCSLEARDRCAPAAIWQQPPSRTIRTDGDFDIATGRLGWERNQSNVTMPGRCH